MTLLLRLWILWLETVLKPTLKPQYTVKTVQNNETSIFYYLRHSFRLH